MNHLLFEAMTFVPVAFRSYRLGLMQSRHTLYKTMPHSHALRIFHAYIICSVSKAGYSVEGAKVLCGSFAECPIQTARFGQDKPAGALYAFVCCYLALHEPVEILQGGHEDKLSLIFWNCSAANVHFRG